MPPPRTDDRVAASRRRRCGRGSRRASSVVRGLRASGAVAAELDGRRRAGAPMHVRPGGRCPRTVETGRRRWRSAWPPPVGGRRRDAAPAASREPPSSDGERPRRRSRPRTVPHSDHSPQVTGRAFWQRPPVVHIAASPAGTARAYPGRVPVDRPEVRRNLGRRSRPHPGRRRSHRADPPPGQPGGRGRLGHGQDHRRPRPARPRRVPATRTAASWTCCSPPGERISMALLCMAIMDLGVHAVSFTGSQAGIVTDTVHGKAKILEVKGDRIRETLADGRGRRRRRLPGHLAPTRDITTLGRGGSDTTAVALAATLGAEVCEIYTDVVGRVHRRPAHRARGAQAPARLVRRDARDGGDRRQGARAALGRVRRATTTCPCTCVRASPGSRAPGWSRRTPTMERRSSPVSPTTPRRPRSRSRRWPTGPASRRRCSARSPTTSVNVDMIVQNVSTAGHTDISFTVPRDDLHRALDACMEKIVAEIEATRRHRTTRDVGRVIARRRGHEDESRVSRPRCSRCSRPRASTSR